MTIKRWIIVTIIPLWVIVTLGVIQVTAGTSNLNKHRCEAFCNCSITNNCSYSFNYDDIANCNCSK